MAGTIGYFKQGFNGGNSREDDDEDFDEEDVWKVVKERKETSPKLKKKKSKDLSSGLTPKGLPTATRMIPKGNNNNNNSINETTKVLQQSAPVSIPDWSKIYKTSSSRKGSNSHSYKDDENDVVVDDDDDDFIVEDDEKNVINDDENPEKLPPHEWIAKKLARNQISSFSVCEGAGRTLKGRDLSKVRNAVLTKTGFLE